MSDLSQAYGAFYRARDPVHVYPVEFVVRAYLGRYPRLAPDVAGYAGTRALDLGFGDGRNMPLLADLGMQVHGVEITAEICRAAVARLARLGVTVDARIGRNASIPFGDGFFQHVLACHSCYYVDPGTTFADNLREIARVTAPGGRFVFSVPIGTSYIMRGARDTGDGHMEIANDPYGVRNGSILKKFDRGPDIGVALAPWFDDAAIGACRNDWWGVEEHVWTVACRRRADGGAAR